MDTEGLIWIADAVKEYSRSREWLDRQTANGTLSIGHIPGDRKVYLVRAELDALLRPQITKRGQDQTG